ncbi:MAG TPA: FAD/NAD(P)-binding protein [Bryobacteraceae bacterium]|nr:FAD/NAD(P)-binding protein [Bryobacteraceae bacterium]
MKEDTAARGDDSLGLNAPIERRDWLNSTLLAAGTLLLGSAAPIQLLAEEDWTGYGGIGDYADSNGNTYEVMTAGHKIRDKAFEGKPLAPISTGEEYDCVVVGGGISGLSAALFFQRQAKNKRCLILDNHPIFGGEAKRNEFQVDGQRLEIHQGSAACFPPLANSFLESFYDSIGVKWDNFTYQKWSGPQPELAVETAPYPTGGKTSAFFFGAKFGHAEGLWLTDPWGKRLEGAPISEQARNELLRRRDQDRKPFSTHSSQPKAHGDEASRHLDSITLEQHFTELYGLSPSTTRTFLSPIAGGGSGLGADALSAYAEYAADVLLPWQYDKGAQMFPGGNAGVARHLVKQLIPDAISGKVSMQGICRGRIRLAALDRGAAQRTNIRLAATVVAVAHAGDPQRAAWVNVDYTKDGRLYRVKAKSVVMAGGSWTAKHILHDMPDNCRTAYAQFHRAPCLMANVAVRNWRFLYNIGLTECQWFEGFGNYITMRKVATFGTDPAIISPDAPTVLNLKVLFSYPGETLAAQTVRGRTELISTPFRVYEARIREQFQLMFGRYGFDARRDIAGIVLNRWGHAYLSPQPGFFFGENGQAAPGEVLRHSPYGRVAFANSDLSGIMDHRMSIGEAQRAVGQILAVSTV